MPVGSAQSKVRAKIWAIVPAAGIGSRMTADRPKQYLPLAGKPILLHTLERLCCCDLVDGVVVGIRDDDPYWRECAFEHEKFLGSAEGGKERAHTVLNAIENLVSENLAQESDWALVHDAVRPCVSQDDIGRLIRCARKNHMGALLGVKITDTLKKSDSQRRVEKTVEREHYWRAMTPQIFPIKALKKALESSIAQGFEATDESAAMERQGIYPELVEGHSSNIKITLQEDLELAEMLILRSLQ